MRRPDEQLEVLVTSLLAEELYPTAEFLVLENWSGETLEAVEQRCKRKIVL